MTQFGYQSRSTSPALIRINARATEIWREVREAESRLSVVNEQIVERAAELEAIRRRLCVAQHEAALANPIITKAERVASIKKDAFRLFLITEAEFLSARRALVFVLARAYAAQRMADEAGFSTPHIGRVLGGRDHTTIMYLLRLPMRQRVADWLATSDTHVNNGED